MTAITPTLTTCDICERRMAAMPGPMNGMKRPPAPIGFRIGYIVEVADRVHTICADCLHETLNVAV